MSVCLSPSLFFSLSLSLSFSPYFSLSPSPSLYFSICLYLPLRLSLSLSLSLYFYPFLSIFLPLSLPPLYHTSMSQVLERLIATLASSGLASPTATAYEPPPPTAQVVEKMDTCPDTDSNGIKCKLWETDPTQRGSYIYIHTYIFTE